MVGFGLDAARIQFAADDILREDPPIFGDTTPYSSVTHLKGHVEIRTCCMQSTKADAAHPYPPRSYTIVHADEVDYHEATGEIEARGTVRITFQEQR
jgi:lipopolysaccharide assembly outer membrane protein LptD (OstA)